MAVFALFTRDQRELLNSTEEVLINHTGSVASIEKDVFLSRRDYWENWTSS